MKFNKNFLTPYPDINEILLFITNEIKNIIEDNLIGVYLFGSLTYSDFNFDSSDIDLITITHRLLNHNELNMLKLLHKRMEQQYPKWSQRLECSYTPIDLFKHILPPKQPRPYYGGGIFYDKAPYGNEWIINNYLLYQYGIALLGQDIKEFIKPIDITEVQKACIRDLFQEWEPKIIDFDWLENSHYQSYLILNLCRILYTVYIGDTSSKKISAQWVKNKWDEWKYLIETAENWQYVKEMKMRDETIHFIKFVIDKIKNTNLYLKIDKINNYTKYGIHQISDFLISVRSWAEQNQEIDGIALVGSYARNQANVDSDIDLIILTHHQKDYISNQHWINKFGEIENIKLENYGAVISWHVHFKNSHEVEFGFALPSWADIPIEQGTREVIINGIVTLYDPKNLFKKLTQHLIDNE